MKKFISHGEVLDNLNIDAVMKESREAQLPKINTKISVGDAMAQATSESTKVEYMSETLIQLVIPGSGGRLDAMHHAINMGYQNIDFLQQTLTGLCSVVRTL